MRRLLKLGGSGRLALAVAALGCAGFVQASAAAPAGAAVTHVIQPGESLWSISMANGFTTESVAAFNGLPADAMLIAGETIEVPTVAEAEAAVAAGGTGTSTPASNGTPSSAAPASSGAPGMATVSGPMGAAPLDPAAAAAFEQMRADSLAQFGIDLYPAGPLSGYRTYEQQAYLYDLYLSGQGAPANPPGTSSHEWGSALDLADPAMRNVVDQIGASYGWHGINNEWWHIQWG